MAIKQKDDSTRLVAKDNGELEDGMESRRETDSTHSTSEEAQNSKDPSKTWTNTQKWLTLSSTCLVCFVVGMNSTGILAATDDISESFGVDLTHFDFSFFLVTAWNTGAAILPLFVLPFMEDFGLQTIYFALYLLFVVFVVVQAVAPNFATLIVSRVIAGSCAGVLQNCVDGIAADMWGDDIDNRAMSMTFYIFSLLGGVTIGPVIGGAIIKTLSWRWILYVQLMIYGAVFPFVLFFFKDPRATASSASKQSTRAKIKVAMNETILRAVRMLFTEFVVGTFTLLSSFAFGTVFLMTQSIPQVYTALYNWSPWQTGVVQVSIFMGEVVGVILCLFQDRLLYPRFGYPNGKSAEAVPEPRLYLQIPCSILGLAAGFFVYGWTAYSTYTWVLPALGLFLIGIGIMVTIQAVSTYVTDCYSSHASSAISAVAFGENIFAAFLPLATRKMYENLGFQWASSLLGFATIALSIAPVVLVFNGDKIRAQSKFTR